MCIRGIVAGALTVGDAVLFLTLMNQLYAPLSFFGSYYRQVRLGSGPAGGPAGRAGGRAGGWSPVGHSVRPLILCLAVPPFFSLCTFLCLSLGGWKEGPVRQLTWRETKWNS